MFSTCQLLICIYYKKPQLRFCNQSSTDAVGPMYITLQARLHPMFKCRQEKIDFWDNVYGFDMSSIKQRALIEPLVDSVDPDQIATSSCQMKAINILDMKVSDAEFEVGFPACTLVCTASHVCTYAGDPLQINHLFCSTTCQLCMYDVPCSLTYAFRFHSVAWHITVYALVHAVMLPLLQC